MRITDANRLQGRDVPRPEAADDQKALTYDQPTEMLKWKAPAASGGGGTSQTDGAAFALGTDPFTPAGGVFDDSPPADLTPGKTGVVRLTKKRAFHFNLRDSNGLEIGTTAAPLRVDPTGGTPQPVTGTFWPASQPVSGTFWQVTQPVSAAALPLPAGAAQEHATAASPHAVRLTDGAAFFDPRDISDRIARLLGTTRRQPADLALTATGLAAAAVTLTLPAAGAGLFHYITAIEIMRTATAALTGNATLVITTTNLPGALAWSVGNAMAAGGMARDVVLAYDSPLRSALANTNTTIVCPVPGAAVLWRVNVLYYVA